MTTAKHRECAREIEQRITSLLNLYLEKYKTADASQQAVQTLAIVTHEIAEALAASHAEGRQEMREEAAKVADALAKSAAENANGNPQKGTTFEQWKDVQQFLHGKRYAAVEIAAAIRALPKDTGNG